MSVWQGDGIVFRGLRELVGVMVARRADGWYVRDTRSGKERIKGPFSSGEAARHAVSEPRP